jgi:tetratricopeptide (TPR) repeat protein
MSEDKAAPLWPEDGRSAVERLQDIVEKGLPGPARERLEREIPAKEAELGPGHPETVMSLLELGNVLMAQGDLEGSVRLARKALKAALGEGGTGPGSHAAIAAATFLGETLTCSDRAVEAAGILKVALGEARGKLGVSHWDTLKAANALSMSLRETGRRQEAEVILSAALKDMKGRPGEGGHLPALTRANLAFLLLMRGDYAGAIKLLKTAYGGMSHQLGPFHPRTLAVGINLAGAMLESGEIEQSIALYKEILKGLGGSPPEMQMMVETTLHNLGWAEAMLGKGGGSVN